MIGKVKSILISALCFFLIIFPQFANAAPLNPTFLDKPIKDIIMDLIKFLLSITGGIALLFLMFSGIYYMISGGSSEGGQKAKKMLMSAITGLALVLLSYTFLVVLDDLFV